MPEIFGGGAEEGYGAGAVFGRDLLLDQLHLCNNCLLLYYLLIDRMYFMVFCGWMFLSLCSLENVQNC